MTVLVGLGGGWLWCAQPHAKHGLSSAATLQSCMQCVCECVCVSAALFVIA